MFICCLHKETLHPWLATNHPMKILIRLQNAQADLNLCWAHMSEGMFFDIVDVIFSLQKSSESLWFGRDVFGRRSLLWHLPETPSDILALSSVRVLPWVSYAALVSTSK